MNPNPKNPKVSAITNDIANYIAFARPFTLLAPALGFLSGGIIALGASHRSAVTIGSHPFLQLILGTLAAALINVYSNAINQIFDVEIDRINKPSRPLPSATISVRNAWVMGLAAAVIALIIASVISTAFLVILAAAGLFTTLYSAPPFRFKRICCLANVVIAIPRGCLVTVAGWSALASPWNPEPWLLSLVLTFFVLGGSSTKDFSDIEGDRRYGCQTLPVKFGVRKSALLIAPFLVFPFLLLPLYSKLNLLSASGTLISLLGFGLALWGAYIGYLMLRRPEELATEANHVSWKHMYLLMVVTSVGLAVVYIV